MHDLGGDGSGGRANSDTVGELGDDSADAACWGWSQWQQMRDNSDGGDG